VVTFALFLHAGTAVSATAYYWDEIEQVMRSIPDWRPSSAFGGSTAELSYLVIATIMTGIVGLPVYFLLSEVISGIQGGMFIVLVGALQGLAVLPGVSRSGVTASALLFRSHDGPSAFRLSFLLSIPAALG
jgi:undecaprenyl-diphosphatase